MNLEKQNKLVPTLIIVLLFTQVALSSGIIWKINEMNQTGIYGLGEKNNPQQNVPEFVEGISIDDDPILGIKDAPVTVIEFADYQCPFCAEAVSNVKAIMSNNPGKILYAYRDFPLEATHPYAFKAAEAANCAGDQDKYWEMHDLLFANQAQLDSDNLKKYANQLQLNLSQFNDCLNNGKYTDEIRHDIDEAKSYQVNATPTFFINGHRLVGPLPEQLQEAIERAINEAEGGLSENMN